MATKREREKRKIKYSNPKERAVKHASGFESTSVHIPEGMSFFSVKAAKAIRVDILPYEVKKGSDEKGGNPHCESGLVHYERTYFSHRGIGAEQTSVCCLRKTFGKKCPICEDQQKRRRDPEEDQKAIKDLDPKERQLFIVRDHADLESGLKLWDISYHLFGKMLDAKIKDADPDDDYEGFYRLDAGKTLKIGFEEKSMGSGPFFACNNIEMKPRKPLPESLLDEVPDLDSLLVEMTYDDLKKYYLQEDDEPADDDDDDTGTDDDDEDEDQDDDDEDDDEDAKPSRNGKKPAGKKPSGKPKREEPADDDDDDNDDDSDDDDGDDSDDSDDDGDGDDEEFKVGDAVLHEEFGRCTIHKVIDGGKKFDLKDEDGKLKKAVFASDVVPDPGEDDDDDDEDEKPKPSGKKPTSKKTAASDDDDDDDDDDWDSDDDEDEKPKPSGKKPAGRKR